MNEKKRLSKKLKNHAQRQQTKIQRIEKEKKESVKKQKMIHKYTRFFF